MAWAGPAELVGVVDEHSVGEQTTFALDDEGFPPGRCIFLGGSTLERWNFRLQAY